MVRRIVGAVQQAGLNKIKLNYIKDSLINKVSSKFMAKTDNLILVDVKYDLKFKKIVQKEKMLIAYEKSFILLNFYKSLLRIEGR
jgi:tRNA U38,U39,U40 pseudouridine synthase TruA